MRAHRFMLSLGTAIIMVLGVAGCATESSQSLAVPKVDAASRPYSGARAPVAVGKFENRSSFMRGIFSDGKDQLGSQAKTVLLTHLQQTNRFIVLDRENMEETRQEASIKNKPQNLKGGDYVIIGSVAEFGRKEVGDVQLFGILGQGKKQVAYAKVVLNVVDSDTSELVFSVQGAGEYELTNRMVVGFGGTAGYDSTLNGKVLDLAMREAINELTAAIDAGAWKPVK